MSSRQRSRREFLARGLGLGAGLAPLLGGLLCAGPLGAEPAPQAARAKRLIAIYAPHGRALEYWLPGPGFDLRYENCSLQPFDDAQGFGRSFREQLVVIVQSEMGRTPTYNQGNGKDHWSIGSIMFLGRGITGNRVIGATDEKQFQVAIHPQSLALDREQAVRVRPEHIHTALRELAGVAEHPFSKRFPLGVPDKERLAGLWA